MRKSINILVNKIEQNINMLKNNIEDENVEFDEIVLNIDIKHILEDMQSVLDYVAVDIHNKYCPNHKLKKIYFIYAPEHGNENDYKNKIENNFPGLYESFRFVYDVLVDNQSFRDDSNWLVKLNDLANEVKHNELFINKTEIEKHTILSGEKTSLEIVGDLITYNEGGRCGVYTNCSIYVKGPGRVGVYANGDITIDDGIYNLESKESSGLAKEYYERKTFFSKKYNIEITEILLLILEKEKQLISRIEHYI